MKAKPNHLLATGFILLALVGGFANHVLAQSIGNDSRDKDIFDFYKTKSISIPASSATGSFKIQGTSALGTPTQYFTSKTFPDHISLLTDAKTKAQTYSPADSAKLTTAGSFGISWSAEVNNIKSDLSKASTFHPGYAISVGIGRNIDVFNDWDNIRKLKFKPIGWNVSIYGKLDNIIIYDTLAKMQNRNHPVSYGMTAEMNVFTRHWITFSISGNIERGNNIADLKSFQDNKPTYMDSQEIALGDVVGKLGDLKNQSLFRLRLSAPIFIPPVRIIQQLQPCIIPYYNYYGAFDGKTNHMFGFFANILGDSFYKPKDNTIVSGAGIGVDWTHNAVWSHAIFVSGSLDLYKLFPHKTTGDSQKL